MKVVGLVSGGKDSIWNLHYCSHFGHETVCVANLAPPEGVHEMDSYMYQTVGYDVIDAIAIAMDLPLVRRVITGKPHETASNVYAPKDGDEVEDLTALLRQVLEEYPEVTAVSCGAILSNYQRLRVENVCQRLGLQMLAFMWMQEQPDLLRQMIDSGIDARICKVASMGLSAKHVGKSILDEAFANHIMSLGQKWGVHVCGEGGEYETTCVDAPLFRRAVHIIDSETVDHEEGGDVAFLVTKEVQTEEKEGGRVGPPYAVLEQFSSLSYYQNSFAPLELGESSESDEARVVAPGVASGASVATSARRPILRQSGPFLTSSSLDVDTFDLSRDGTPAEQCAALLTAVSAWLAGLERDLKHVVHCEVQVSDLGCFGPMNSEYARFFDIEPPSRVCIQTTLPEGLLLRLRILVRDAGKDDEALKFQSLRVQSISTWAMPCIGPYSQATRIGPFLFSAGVLGLIPHSVVFPTFEQLAKHLPDRSGRGDMQQWEVELWLLMRSLHNVLKEMGSSFGEARLACVYTVGERNFAAVSQLVLAYMQREDPHAAPLIALAEVPRLPKDGRIEINLVCSPSETAAQIASVPSGPDAPVAVSRPLQGAWVCSSESGVQVQGADVSGAQIARCAEQCVTAVWRQLQENVGDVPGEFSLQVQYAFTSAHCLVSTAVEEAVASILMTEKCAISYMPVSYLGAGIHLRVVALTGGA